MLLTHSVSGSLDSLAERVADLIAQLRTARRSDQPIAGPSGLLELLASGTNVCDLMPAGSAAAGAEERALAREQLARAEEQRSELASDFARLQRSYAGAHVAARCSFQRSK
jgi:hypothetical protein